MKQTRNYASECRRCGYRLVGLVIQVEDEFLRRCPVCDAYDWTPEPLKVGAYV